MKKTKDNTMDYTNYLPTEDESSENCYAAGIGCAAALMSKYTLLKVIKGNLIGEYKFIFKKQKGIDKMAYQYNNNLLKVDAELMYENMRLLYIKISKI